MGGCNGVILPTSFTDDTLDVRYSLRFDEQTGSEKPKPERGHPFKSLNQSRTYSESSND